MYIYIYIYIRSSSGLRIDGIQVLATINVLLIIIIVLTMY